MEKEHQLQRLFNRIESLTSKYQCESIESLPKINVASSKESFSSQPPQWLYIEKLIAAVTELSDLIKNDTSILISVKNQKLLRCCFQLITSLGLLPCLIPGVGINLSKRLEKSSRLMEMEDTKKYSLLKKCADFYINSYNIPVLKNIILTSHLADYLAALIQLSFAPLKKPGDYDGFTMTQDMYDQMHNDRIKYVPIYESLVSTCFQPMIMKELLVLQSGTDPAPPAFLKRIISKELSNRLVAPGGLLSLIRCFIESQSIDSGYEWKKVDMIRRIIATKHGSLSEEVYLSNICKQLNEIISSSNVHYYSTAAACILYLREKYHQNLEIVELSDGILKSFELRHLEKQNLMPGSIILTSQEVEHNVNILHSFFCSMRLNQTIGLLTSNLYVLFLLRLKCTKSEEMQNKLDNLIFYHFEESNNDNHVIEMKQLLFGDGLKVSFLIEEFDTGMVLKKTATCLNHPVQEASKYFTEQLKRNTNIKIGEKIFEVCLEKLQALKELRNERDNRSLLELEDELELVDNLDAVYAVTLQLLEELCGIPKVLSSVMKHPECILKFIEDILLKSKLNKADECATIALVLLNTLLSESEDGESLKKKCLRFLPVLRSISADDLESSFLAKEIYEMITDVSSSRSNKNSEFASAISNIFDNMLPVRAHGIIELTKLIDKKDPETLSKKHYVLCLFQEQLKDEDSYVYLSAINGIAALSRHCTEDVLNLLCKEFLESSVHSAVVETAEMNEKRAQLRMKVGDVIVKVTRSLGEMAVVHKALLLNTILCVCRDHDPFIRASALSNLAEVARVLHYRVGTILYEILLCICSILDSDTSPECRRAAVMVISSLLKGLGKETLIQLKDTLLPIYRTLKKLYNDPEEDSVVRLHAQIALEELNDIVTDFLFKKVEMERKFVISDTDKMDIKFK